MAGGAEVLAGVVAELESDSACCSRKCYARTAMSVNVELLSHVWFGHSILEAFADVDDEGCFAEHRCSLLKEPGDEAAHAPGTTGRVSSADRYKHADTATDCSVDAGLA